MKLLSKTSIFGLIFFLSGALQAQITIEPPVDEPPVDQEPPAPIAVGPIAQLSMNVRQSNLDVVSDSDAETFQRGTIRNVARLDIRNLSRLQEELFSESGVTFNIQVNDRASVSVPVAFQAGDTRVNVGRASVIDAANFVDDGSLRGRVRADYDAATDTLSLRYIERVNLNTSVSRLELLDARRFSVSIVFGYNDPDRGQLFFTASAEAPLAEFTYLR